MKEINTCKGT